MKYVVVDIDGTLSKVGERLKYLQQDPPDWDRFYEDCFEDEPIEPIIGLLDSLMCSEFGLTPSFDVVFCTGRRESVQTKTRKWLFEHLENYCGEPILMRPDNDHRHDTEVKPELLAAAGITPENTAFILEDRNSMVKKWRELGFTCLQVAEGEFQTQKIIHYFIH